MSIQLSDIKIWPNKKGGTNTKAFGSVTVNGVVRVSFTIVEGSKGLFASLPGHKGKGKDKDGNMIDNKWYSDVYIVDKEDNVEFQKQLVAAHKAHQGGQASAGEDNQTDGLPF